MWEIDYYTKANGECPLEEFLNHPDQKNDLPFILNKIDQLAEFGNMLGKPHTRKLVDSIFELRLKTNRGIYRFPFFYEQNKVIILTHGFLKKAEKTPVAEITRAQKYKNDHFERKKK